MIRVKTSGLIYALAGLAVVTAGLCFVVFLVALFDRWLHNEQFSYGLFIPPIVVYLLWERRAKLKVAPLSSWTPGFLLAGTACGLQIVATRSGTLLLSGLAFVTLLIGVTGFLLGLQILRLCAGSLSLLIFMVPLPSYAIGQVTWCLQSMASSLSGQCLDLLGVPVLQDGNLLRLPNYVLEVKQACSGSNAIVALVALALILGLNTGDKWWKRVVLVACALPLAIIINVIRIVGTGLVVRQWGDLAANESLHFAWGLAVFMLGLVGLFGINSLLRMKACRIA